MSIIRKIREFFRSDIAKQSDSEHAAFRAEQAQMIAAGKGAAYNEESAKLLGLSTDPNKRPKMIFGKASSTRSTKLRPDKR